MRKPTIWIMLLVAAAAPATTAAQTIAPSASVHFATARWLHPPVRAGNVCGDALFSLEEDTLRPRLVCLATTTSGAPYTVTSATDLGNYPSIPSPVVNATADQPAAMFWTPPTLHRLDLGDGSIAQVAQLMPFLDWEWRPSVFDREGDGSLELLHDRAGTNAIDIRILPSGTLAASLSGAPWSEAAPTLVGGQLDADAAGEIAFWQADGLVIHDAVTLQPQGPPVATLLVPNQRAPRPVDLDRNGRQEILFEATTGWVGYIDPDDSSPIRLFNLPEDDPVLGTIAVDWIAGGAQELAVLGTRHIAVFDRRNSVPLDLARIPTNLQPRFESGYQFGSDVRAGAQPALLWRSPTHVVEWRRGAAPRAAMFAVSGVAAISSPRTTADGEILSVLVGDGAEPDATAWIVRHAPMTLRELGRTPIPESRDSLLSIGDPSDAAGREILAVRRNRITLYDSAGNPLWQTTPIPALGEVWRKSAMVAHPCTVATCRRLLVERKAEASPSGGSRLFLLDGRDGAILWESPGDNCTSCGYTSLALGDVDGDEAPELLSVRRLIDEIVELRDGATRALRWRRDFTGFLGGPVDVAISGSLRRTIALLRQTNTPDTELIVVSATDGATIATRTIPGVASVLRFLPVGANGGYWLVGGLGASSWLVREDLSGPLQRVAIERVVGAGGSDAGDAYVAGRWSVHALSLPGERVFADGLEP